MCFGDRYTLIAHFNLDSSCGVDVGIEVITLGVSVDSLYDRCLGQRVFI